MELIEVSIESKWARLVRSPVYYILEALSAVAATFLPMFLYELGREGADYSDWRVITCWLTTVLICVVHFRLSAPVMRALRSAKKLR